MARKNKPKAPTLTIPNKAKECHYCIFFTGNEPPHEVCTKDHRPRWFSKGNPQEIGYKRRCKDYIETTVPIRFRPILRARLATYDKGNCQ